MLESDVAVKRQCGYLLGAKFRLGSPRQTRSRPPRQIALALRLLRKVAWLPRPTDRVLLNVPHSERIASEVPLQQGAYPERARYSLFQSFEAQEGTIGETPPMGASQNGRAWHTYEPQPNSGRLAAFFGAGVPAMACQLLCAGVFGTEATVTLGVIAPLPRLQRAGQSVQRKNGGWPMKRRYRRIAFFNSGILIIGAFARLGSGLRARDATVRNMLLTPRRGGDRRPRAV